MLDRPTKPQTERMLPRHASNWYILRTSPRAVWWVKRLGLGVYEPTRLIESRHRRTKKWVTRAERLLAGYLFVEFTFDERPTGRPRFDDWQALLACPGVHDVMGISDGAYGVPYAVPTRIVERLIRAQAGMEWDDTRAARRKRREVGGTEIEDLRLMYPVSSALIATDGPFKGLVGTVSNVTARGEIEALVAMLGQLVPVIFPHQQDRPALAFEPELM